MAEYQLAMDLYRTAKVTLSELPYDERIEALLSADLGFHGQNGHHTSHTLHSFPAKFPPALPAHFVEGLTDPGDVVLDPMMGSGTTVLEAQLRGRRAIGTDIDPLALLLTSVKTTQLDLRQARHAGLKIARHAAESLQHPTRWDLWLDESFDTKTKDFVDYWFPLQSQRELAALSDGIRSCESASVAAFLKLTLSAVIITKSSPVSWARDLAHTRPHKVKDKKIKSALDEFTKRLDRNLKAMGTLSAGEHPSAIMAADARTLPIRDSSIDLIVTSPPYAANAIDYMRAHKFSLVWLGHDLSSLSTKRKEYVGGESLTGVSLHELPSDVREIISQVAELDSKRAGALHRYYSEIHDLLKEMRRVLKPGKAAILVVGTSLMKGIDISVSQCLMAIAETIGLENAGYGVRVLDRDRRMMPTRWRSSDSQIENRMHEEFVLAFRRPAASDRGDTGCR